MDRLSEKHEGKNRGADDMMQSIVQLPESADIDIVSGGFRLVIKDHKIQSEPYTRTLLSIWLLDVIRADSWKQTVAEMKLQNFSFEAVIDTCGSEMQEYPRLLEYIIHTQYKLDFDFSKRAKFSASYQGMEISEIIASKIKDCSNWDELYHVMKMDGLFQKNMRERTRKQMT